MLHHTLLSPPGIWGHHLSVTYFIFRALSQMLSLPLVGFSSCTLLLWALKLLFVVVGALDPNSFDVTLESFIFGMCWSYVVPQLCFAPERHIYCKGIQFLCGHHNCGHWEGFHLKIAYHRSCTQVQNSFFWNMLRFVATRLAGCHRLTLKSWKNFVFEDRKIPDK